MRVDTSLLDGISVASAAAKTAKSQKTTGTTSFSSALKSATTTTESDTTSTKKAAATEKTHAVDGKPYADITAGPRSGMYLNTSGNARDGDAFVMVKRHGREYHIYGTGEDRKVIGLRTAAERTADAATPAGTDSADKTSTSTASLTDSTS